MSKSKFRTFIDPIVDTMFQKMFPNWSKHLKKDLADCDSVLDLGCGYDSFIQYCNVPYSVGVDLHEPYIEESKRKGIHNQYIKADISQLEFEPKSFDAVIAIAVIEHMPKGDGFALIQNMEKWARKKIIITTPNGFIRHDAIHNNPRQVHISSWHTGELRELGFKVVGTFGWKPLRGYEGYPKYKPAFLWEVISGITQYVTYYCPRLAFVLHARKDL